MRCIEPGHRYVLQDNKSDVHANNLQFFQDGAINGGDNVPGTTNQEVLRALINRVAFLNEQVPNPVNYQITKHLRMALALHEMRHIERLVDKDYPIEEIPVKKNGHFI